MAQSADRPLDSGRIAMPSYTAGENRAYPRSGDTEKPLALRQTAKKPRSDEEAQEILRRARKNFEEDSSAESENRREGLDDDKFFAGDQWPASVLAERDTAKRPAHTINKFPTFVHQVTNAFRENPPGTNISPVGDRGDVEAARMYKGMIRAIHRASSAEVAHGTAFDSQVRKGWGYWRVVTEYEAPDSFRQVLKIKRVRNSYSVYLDRAHQEPDGSDAKRAFVTEMVPREEFKRLYPEADPMNWVEGGFGDDFKEWVNQDSIRIAEYYEMTFERRTLVELDNGQARWEDEIDRSMRDHIIDERSSEVPRIMWYKLTARDILEETEWPGAYIPIIKVVGDEIDIEGKVSTWGVVRHAKDSQRQYNYWATAETELVALAPKAPWVLAEGQDEGYEDEWRTANIRPHPILHYRPISLEGHPVPPPQRQPFAEIPTGVANARQTAAQDMMATTGIRFDASPMERAYDESGRALRELRRSGDITTFHYADNFARALRYEATILIDLIPKVYVRKQISTILREDDEEEVIEIDPNAQQATQEVRRQGKIMTVFNPTIGKYGVTPTIGPSNETKRQETAESMMDFIKAVPAAGPIAMDLIAKYMDWPGAEEFAKRFAAALPPGLLQPEMKDVPPQAQAMLAQMQQQIQQLQTERVAMLKVIEDQSADRALTKEKQDQDFEAKLLGIIQKAEQAMMATAQKSEAVFTQQVGAGIRELAESVNVLRDTLAAQPARNGRDDG